MDAGTRRTPTPDRTDVIPESYAVHVTEDRIAVWQYRVSIDEPEGAWTFVERLDRATDPKLSLEQARPMPPESGGYWIYGTSYDCELDCGE